MRSMIVLAIAGALCGFFGGWAGAIGFVVGGCAIAAVGAWEASR